MKTIQTSYSNTLLINKSQFITNIFSVKNVEEVNEILAKTKKKYYDATHNCYAYVLGENGEVQKCSDDGEPQKTAGAPMLDVLKKQEITDILAITTRYFGGTLLGAGGLIRAYSNSVSETIKKAQFYIKKEISEYKLFLTYPLYNSLLIYINTANIVQTIFTEDVMVLLQIESENKELFINNIIEKSNGKAIFSFIKTDYVLKSI